LQIFANQDDEDAGVNPDHTRQAGQWSTAQDDKQLSYDRRIKSSVLLSRSGHQRTCVQAGGKNYYNVPHANIITPHMDRLKPFIFPFLEQRYSTSSPILDEVFDEDGEEDLEDSLEKNLPTDLTASTHIKLLHRCRVWILQAAPYLQAQYPNHIIWSHAVFSSDFYPRHESQFEQLLQANIEQSGQIEADLLKYTTDPVTLETLQAMSKEIMGLREQVGGLAESIKTLQESLDGVNTANHTKETIKYIPIQPAAKKRKSSNYNSLQSTPQKTPKPSTQNVFQDIGTPQSRATRPKDSPASIEVPIARGRFARFTEAHWNMIDVKTLNATDEALEILELDPIGSLGTLIMYGLNGSVASVASCLFRREISFGRKRIGAKVQLNLCSI